MLLTSCLPSWATKLRQIGDEEIGRLGRSGISHMSLDSTGYFAEKLSEQQRESRDLHLGTAGLVSVQPRGRRKWRTAEK